MSTTLKELAAELSLSPATVSMALRNSPLIAQKTRLRVTRLASARGYIRNDIGVALKMRRTRLIGVLIPGVIQSFYNEVLQGAGEAAAEAGYALLLGWAGDENGTAAQLRLMLEKNVDALIVADKNLTGNPMLLTFLERKKPVVFCTGFPAKHCSCVRNDDHLGGVLALEMLAKKGHKAVLASTQWPARYAGNSEAAKARGVTLYPYALTGEIVPALRRHGEITGILCYSDDEAIRILHELRTGGIRVPEDISLVGFDDLPVAALPEFSLTTIAQQRSRLGGEAVRLAIVQAKAGERAIPRELLLAPQTVMRNTVSAPRKNSLILN